MSTMQARIAPLSGAEASTNGWATRVTLQPIAAPSALGLAGFSVATLMVWMVGLASVTWTCVAGAMLENGAVFLVLASLAVGVSLSAAGFITGGQ
jgi:hypothetical protein